MNERAFPNSTSFPPVEGMSMRDYFAAHALVMFSAPDILKAIRETATTRKLSDANVMAAFLYELADAMVIEREKVR